MSTRIQNRRGTAAQWTAANPVLAAGEMGVETDTGKHRIGDGGTAWADLPYFIDETTAASHIGDPATTLGASAAAAYGKRDLIAPLIGHKPFYWAHRGTANAYWHPEYSMEGMIAAGEAGFGIEFDVQALGDGTLVLLHDDGATAVQRTMVGITGGVSDKTVADWRKARLRPIAPGGITPRAVTFEEALDRLGGRYPITMELKGTADSQAAQDMFRILHERHLEHSVILSSFDTTFGPAALADGFPYVVADSTFGTPQEIIDAGYTFVGCGNSVPDSTVTALANAGLTVNCWTINDKPTADARLAAGAHQIMGDDPFKLSRWITPAHKWDFSNGFGFPMAVYQNDNSSMERGTLDLFKEEFRFDYFSGTSFSSVVLGMFGEQACAGTYRFKHQFLPGSSGQTQWACFFVGHTDGDHPYMHSAAYDDALANGYMFMFRRNGETKIYAYQNGAAAQIADQYSGFTAYVPDVSSTGPEVEFEVTISSTLVKIACLTSGYTANTTSATTGLLTAPPPDAKVSIGAYGTACRFPRFTVDRGYTSI